MEYQPRPHTTQHWIVTKPAARGRNGIVAAQAREAAEAGLAVLDAGGNAADAAVATAFALAVVEPWNSGLGGTGFALVHPAGRERAEVVDFGPVAPRALAPERFALTGRMKQELFAWPEVANDANIHGPLSFVIPSAVAGYAALHDRWGRLPLADIMAPAVALARRGLSADWFTTLKIANSAALLRLYQESARIYLSDGLPPVTPYRGAPGFLPLGNLGATLDRLRHAGLRDFYEGEIAAGIARDIRAIGGLIDAEDLRSCAPRFRPAMEVAWGGGRTLQLPGGLTASPTFARVLELLHAKPVPKTPDASWYAWLARSLKLAYRERLAGIGDAEPKAAESCTTHLTVVDADGGMVALTSTLLSLMGSRVVLPGSGVLMNNGVMWFDPRPGQPNSMAPGKRPLCNMCPVIVADGTRPALAAGASGGRRILPAMVQMLAFIADFGMDAEAAAHHPRIDVSDPDEIIADRRLPQQILDALAAEGPLQLIEHTVLPGNFASPNLIESRADGTRVGISDVMSPWSAALAQA
ncbi:MAG: gamma-glutamyltransferase [Acetobacteraceae bacterium]